MDDVFEPDDLDFMSPRDRLLALNLDPETTITSESPVSVGPRIESPRRKPAPGNIRFRVSEVARERGVVHPRGQYANQVNMVAIARGTDLAYTTVLSYVNTPNDVAMIYMDTLARLCDFLRCTPGDLMQYAPKLAGRAVMSEAYKKGAV